MKSSQKLRVPITPKSKLYSHQGGYSDNLKLIHIPSPGLCAPQVAPMGHLQEPSLTNWLPQLCPAPSFPPQSLTLGFPLSFHPEGGERLDLPQKDKPFPTTNGGNKLARDSRTQGTSSPLLFAGRISLKSPAARREGCSRPPPSSPTELPKIREINRGPARKRKRTGHRNLANIGRCVGLARFLSALSSLI